MEIPENTRDNTEEIVEKLVERCIRNLENGNWTEISWQETTRSIAYKVAMMFVAKGYHASEYIVRDRGWSYTTISTYAQDNSSHPKSYTRVIG